MIVIGKEEYEDCEAVHRLNVAAFDNGPEADLVDKLRASCKEYLSFVAVEDDAIVGHILFTPATVVKGDGQLPEGWPYDNQQ